MAMPKRIKVEFGDVFPHGAFAVFEVSKLLDFDRSSKDREVQAKDDDSGLLLWTVDVLDADPAARKADRQFSVRIAAKVQPVLPPPLPDLPFTAVEFEGMTATPYVSENGAGRARLAWSFRATGVKAPGGRLSAKAAGNSGGA